jgi:hypothetical protein
MALASLAGAQENFTQWAKFKAYRVNTSNASGLALGANVLKFPLLVRLTAADSAIFKEAKTGGADIRFVKSDGVTPLKYQIERWDSAGRSAALWVLLDTLYSNNNTRTTRMYWGNAAAADSSKGAAVFDTANGFQAVWHMNASLNTDNEPDATVNGFTATQSSNPGIASGVAGGARNFAGGGGGGGSNNDYFDVNGSNTGKLAFDMNSRYTLSAWAQLTGNASANRTIVQKHDRNWALQINGGTRWEAFSYNSNRGSVTTPAPIGDPAAIWGWQAAADTVNGAPIAGWHHVAAVRDSNVERLYVNGVLAGLNLGNDTAKFSGGNSANPRLDTSRVRIGKQAEGTGSSTRNWSGNLDEVTLSNVARSANFIRMSYETQKLNQVAVTAVTAPLLVYGKDTLASEAGYVVLPLAPTVVVTSPVVTYSVSPALPAGLTLNTATGVISGTPTTAGNTVHAVTATNSEGTAVDSVYIRIAAATEANYSAWTGTKTVNFRSPAMAAAQTHYPILIRLTPSADSLVFVQAKAGGADLRFSRANGTRLRYQLESWDATSRNASVWVQMDNVASAANHEIRIHWGNASANSQSTGSGVFAKELGYQAVWHMNAGGTGNESDATSNGFTANATNAPADTVGLIGRARAFNGTNQYFMVPNSASGALNLQMNQSYTLSSWVYLDSILTASNGNGQKIIEKGDNQYTLAFYNNNGTNAGKFWEITTRGNNGYLQATSQASGVTTDQTRRAWRHIVGTWQGGAVGHPMVEKLYIDGKLIQTLNLQNVSNSGRDTAYNVFIGTAASGGGPLGTSYARYWYGLLDELNITTTAQSADVIALNYKTQKPGVAPVSSVAYANANASYTIGSAITANAPVVKGSVSRYSVSPALPAGLVLNDTTGVISGTPTTLGSGAHTVTAWNDSTWFATATVNIAVTLGAETYSTWGNNGRKYINTTVNNGAAVRGLVRNFPVLIRLNSTNFNTGFAQSVGKGADVRFTKANGVVRLPHQVESWDSAGKTAAIWVLVDSIKADERDQYINMYWNKTGVPNASSGTEVFSAANGFMAVYHLNDSTTQVDASGQGNAGTASPTAPTAATNALIGGAKTFNGTSNWYQIGTDSTALNVNTETGPYTVSAWVNPASCDARIAAIAKYTNGANPPGRQFALHTNASFTDWRFTSGSVATAGEFTADAPGSCVTGSWSQIVGTYRSGATPTADSAVNAKIYVNGVLAGQGASVTITGAGRQANAYIGRLHGAERYMNGSLDEITVSTVLRDTNWIKLSFETQKAGSIVVTDTMRAVTSIGNVAAQFTGRSLMVKTAGKGLLFQIQGVEAGKANVSLVDMWGRTVWNNAAQINAGLNNVSWNGNANNGVAVSSGIYIVRVSLIDAAGKQVGTLQRTVPFAR